MAGNEIYIGKMLEAFNRKMDAFSTDMAESVAAMRAVEKSVVEVAMNTSQSISVVSVGPGTENTLTLDSVQKTYQEIFGGTDTRKYAEYTVGTTADTYGDKKNVLGKITSNAQGLIKVNFSGITLNMKHSDSLGTITIGFFINDGTNETTVIESKATATTTSSYKNISFPAANNTVAINPGKQYDLYFKFKGAYNSTCTLSINTVNPISEVYFPSGLLIAGYNLVNKVSNPIIIA